MVQVRAYGRFCGHRQGRFSAGIEARVRREAADKEIYRARPSLPDAGGGIGTVTAQVERNNLNNGAKLLSARTVRKHKIAIMLDETHRPYPDGPRIPATSEYNTSQDPAFVAMVMLVGAFA